MFKQYDRDNSGYLTVSELKQALAKAGYIFSDAEISRFVASIDANNDGKVSLSGMFWILLNWWFLKINLNIIKYEIRVC